MNNIQTINLTEAVRLGADRVRHIEAWPPFAGESSKAHAIRKAEAVAEEIVRTCQRIHNAIHAADLTEPP